MKNAFELQITAADQRSGFIEYAEVEEGTNNFFKNSIGLVRFHFAK